MKVLVTGATGFVGRKLVASLKEAGDVPVAVSRDVTAAGRSLPGVEVARAAPTDAAALAAALTGVDAVVNLAGDNIAAGRWSPAKKARIRESRVGVTRAVAEAIRKAAGSGGPAPRVLVSASAIGYYGPRGDEAIDESAGAGSDFLAGVCNAWESEAFAASDVVRVVVLRFGVVLGKGGGALAKMLPPFRMFVGGPIGSGKQWMSWIHVDDVTGLVRHALVTEGLAGPVNATAPEAMTNRDFSRTLGKVLGRPSWAPVPPPVLRVVLGEMADLLTTGQRVAPKRAVESGYAFRFPTLERALTDILSV